MCMYVCIFAPISQASYGSGASHGDDAGDGGKGVVKNTDIPKNLDIQKNGTFKKIDIPKITIIFQKSGHSSNSTHSQEWCI